jgi:hypothetical protein
MHLSTLGRQVMQERSLKPIVFVMLLLVWLSSQAQSANTDFCVWSRFKTEWGNAGKLEREELSNKFFENQAVSSCRSIHNFEEIIFVLFQEYLRPENVSFRIGFDDKLAIGISKSSEKTSVVVPIFKRILNEETTKENTHRQFRIVRLLSGWGYGNVNAQWGLAEVWHGIQAKFDNTQSVIPYSPENGADVLYRFLLEPTMRESALQDLLFTVQNCIAKEDIQTVSKSLCERLLQGKMKKGMESVTISNYRLVMGLIGSFLPTAMRNDTDCSSAT